MAYRVARSQVKRRSFAPRDSLRTAEKRGSTQFPRRSPCHQGTIAATPPSERRSDTTYRVGGDRAREPQDPSEFRRPLRLGPRLPRRVRQGLCVHTDQPRSEPDLEPRRERAHRHGNRHAHVSAPLPSARADGRRSCARRASRARGRLGRRRRRSLQQRRSPDARGSPRAPRDERRQRPRTRRPPCVSAPRGDGAHHGDAHPRAAGLRDDQRGPRRPRGNLDHAPHHRPQRTLRHHVPPRPRAPRGLQKPPSRAARSLASRASSSAT